MPLPPTVEVLGAFSPSIQPRPQARAVLPDKDSSNLQIQILPVSSAFIITMKCSISNSSSSLISPS